MTPEQEILFLQFMLDQGYRNPRPIGRGRYGCILKMCFTHALIVGQLGDEHGYDDRWCYHDYHAAKDALDQWNGDGEPDGWHRHPSSGRRRAPIKGAIDDHGRAVAAGNLYVLR
jgi:hypothetical protein